jgi:arylsulfatase A-like enzyme
MHKNPIKQTQKRSLSTHPFTRRDFLSTGLKAGAAAFTTGLLPKPHAVSDGQYNVVFIIADDLRPLLGCYDNPEIYTPNIDRLAERSTLFNRAYCQYPLCHPSRTSMLTGLRPDTSGVQNNHVGFRQTVPDAVTLPQYFKVHGYHTRSVGKIEHGSADLYDELSWSVPIWRPGGHPYKGIPAWQALDVADDELRDGKTAKRAMQVLDEIRDLPFFLAVGFDKPHLPYSVPKKYFGLYDTHTFKTRPAIFLPFRHEITHYSDIPSDGTPLSEEKILELARGYLAAISYMDAQVGRVLNHLDVLGLTDRTVVIFSSDHGYHIGEHGMWGKDTLFDESLRVPLIVNIPGKLGSKTDALVELVDLYPTLCEACHLPTPTGLEGVSMVPVINQPTRSWKTEVYSQTRSLSVDRRSVRTDQYRYTEERSRWQIEADAGRELYNYHVDPDGTTNVAYLPENKDLVAYLRKKLYDRWQIILPDPQTLPWDVNDDGIVNILDLVLISNSLGAAAPKHPKADVNQDGNIDIIDLLLVAAHLGESGNPAAPSTHVDIDTKHLGLVKRWLIDAHLANDGSSIFRRGIAALEELIDSALPTETVLLPNYPNPFNPETWIPYDLAEDSDVEIRIYNLRGESVRRLSIGFQVAGTYRSRSRAAYWDGRNTVDEPVASGVYFYTLQVGQVKVARQMLIVK